MEGLFGGKRIGHKPIIDLSLVCSDLIDGEKRAFLQLSWMYSRNVLYLVTFAVLCKEKGKLKCLLIFHLSQEKQKEDGRF